MKFAVDQSSDEPSEERWSNIGVHPTPAAFVRFFASVVATQVAAHFQRSQKLKIMDACAGDGRLGHAVARRLVRAGFNIELIFVESRLNQNIQPGLSYSTRVLRENFFCLEPDIRADLVLSNPPYLALARSTATNLGITWEDALLSGRNLYGLALRRCIEHCVSGGMVGFLAPHGWLTNQGTAELRRFVRRNASEIQVDAFSSRRLFPEVNQDVSVQILWKREKVGERKKLSVSIGYDRKEKSRFSPLFDSPHLSGRRAKVGLFVWNRETEKISKIRAGIPIIYGGNIQANGSLKENPKYSHRQWAVRSKVPLSYIHSAPCIVIKRSMRGHPGAWHLDLAVVNQKGYRFVAENHVVVVSFPPATNVSEMNAVAARLKSFMEESHRHSGHPNVSVAQLNKALASLR